MGVGSGNGKLLIFGEHAAVYGHPALGLSLPWSLTATHHPGAGWDLPGLGPHEEQVRSLLERLGELARTEGLPLPAPGRLEVATSLPPGSGFGSSGALCAALVRAFWPSLTLEHHDRLAWMAEGLFHGTPSGIDTALALRSGWWQLDASTRPVRARALPDPGLVLVVGSLVRDSDTKTLVGGLARRRDAEPRVFEALELLGDLARQAIKNVELGQSSQLPNLIQSARDGLQGLGLETPALASVLDRGLACDGALGAKLSGAGGGGAFLVQFQDRESALASLEAIEGAVAASLWTSKPRVVG